MARPKRQNVRSDQPRDSRPVRELKEDLGLDEDEWKEFLRHALNGFADYERAHFFESDEPLRLRVAPAEWFEDPMPLGFVTLRVLKEGNPELASRVAWFFLQCWEAEPCNFEGPPGIGTSWLYLSRQGVNSPVNAAGWAQLAFQIPEDFFQGLAEDDLIPLIRLIIENRKPLEAWDLHVLLVAIDRARIHSRAPFRVFDDLITFERIPLETRKELCRGILECPEEYRRIQERVKAVQDFFQQDDGSTYIPRSYLDLPYGGAGRRHPGLKRHAVRALAENLGEPLQEVLSEFFLQNHGDQQSTAAVSEGVLDLIRIHAEELGPDVVKGWLCQGIRKGKAFVRVASYRIGAELFGPAFARPALKDSARMVRDWAAKSLSKDKPRRGSKSPTSQHKLEVPPEE